MRYRGDVGVDLIFCFLGDVIGDRGENFVLLFMLINVMFCNGFSKGISGLFFNNFCGMLCLIIKYVLCVLFLVFLV